MFTCVIYSHGYMNTSIMTACSSYVMLSLLIRRLYKYELRLKFAKPVDVASHIIDREVHCIAWRLRRSITGGARANAMYVFCFHPHPHLWICILVIHTFGPAHKPSTNMLWGLACAGQLLIIIVCKWSPLKVKAAALSAKT